MQRKKERKNKKSNTLKKYKKTVNNTMDKNFIINKSRKR